MMQPVMTLVGNLGYVSVAVSGSLLAIAGTIQVGDIQAFIQYVRNLTQPISILAQVSNMLQSMAAAAERVFEFLDEEEEEDDSTEVPDPASFRGDVEFDHVRFGYDPEKIIIRDFCASVRSGQTVAIVGPTGAGKTTMVKLLMRFYDVTGEVSASTAMTYGNTGAEISVSSSAWSSRIPGSLRARLWKISDTDRLDATDEEVIEAAKAANAHHFIQTLPGGYQMELNEDASNVSQGQKLLLTIARAILADSRIMILDEATSSVDTRTEARIQQAMNRLMEGRTSFVIAHRLSTIRDADLILVLRDGRYHRTGKTQRAPRKGRFLRRPL